MKKEIIFVVIILLLPISVAADGRFIPGDINSDGSVDLSDPIATLSYLFQGNVEPDCLQAGDSNNDGNLDIADAVKTLNYLFCNHYIVIINRKI